MLHYLPVKGFLVGASCCAVLFVHCLSGLMWCELVLWCAGIWFYPLMWCEIGSQELKPLFDDAKGDPNECN